MKGQVVDLVLVRRLLDNRLDHALRGRAALEVEIETAKAAAIAGDAGAEARVQSLLNVETMQVMIETALRLVIEDIEGLAKPAN